MRGTTWYSLYGIIVHAGRGSKSGHYYSFVKRGDQWYHCNDERVTKINDINKILNQQNAYILLYKYRIPNPKKTAKYSASQPSSALTLNKTKSMTVEIKETHENKDDSYMPLSGFFEGKEEVNSEEEEEKLVTAEPQQEEEKFSQLDYIMANFEDVDLENLNDSELMKKISYIDLSDKTLTTPQLKSYISNTLSLNKNHAIPADPPLGPEDDIDGIKMPKPIKRKRKREDIQPTPILSKPSPSKIKAAPDPDVPQLAPKGAKRKAKEFHKRKKGRNIP